MSHRIWQGVTLVSNAFSNHRGTKILKRYKQLYSTRSQRRGMYWPISGKHLLYSIPCVPPELCGKEGLSWMQSDSSPEFPTRGASVNAAIDMALVSDRDLSSRYSSIDLVHLVVQCGRGCAMFKRDLKQIPVNPGDIHVLGWKWDNKLYFDTALPMGLKSAALFCQWVTNFIRHILEDKGVSKVNYLDVFGGGGGGLLSGSRLRGTTSC